MKGEGYHDIALRVHMAKAKKAGAERTAFLAQMSHIAPNVELGHLYGLAMASVARKSVVRLNSNTKSRFCKKCFVPRSLATTEWRIEDLSTKKNRPTMVLKCRCGDIRRRPLWNSDQAGP